jgi:hypothetical protein
LEGPERLFLDQPDEKKFERQHFTLEMSRNGNDCIVHTQQCTADTTDLREAFRDSGFQLLPHGKIDWQLDLIFLVNIDIDRDFSQSQ